MAQHFDVASITDLQGMKTVEWQESAISESQDSFLQLVEKNHAFNFQLWYEEDKARREDMGFEYVYCAKRKIDGFNQRRNNMIEAMDESVFHHLKPKAASDCPVNSETPGMMIDRLSILALKFYHMRRQTERTDVCETHQSECRQKCEVIEQQLSQLAACLETLLTEISQGVRTFRVYHQFKMYNDPTLNPQLYENVG